MANCPKVPSVESWLCCSPRCYTTRRESQEPSFFPSQGNPVNAIPPLSRTAVEGWVGLGVCSYAPSLPSPAARERGNGVHPIPRR